MDQDKLRMLNEWATGVRNSIYPNGNLDFIKYSNQNTVGPRNMEQAIEQLGTKIHKQKPLFNVNTSSIKSSIPMQKNIVPGMKLGNSLGGPIGIGAMLLPAWYGKDKYGVSGPGRAVMDTILGRDEINPEIIKKKQEFDDMVAKFFTKKDNKDNTKIKDTGVPFEIIEESELNNIGNINPTSTNQLPPKEIIEQIENNNQEIKGDIPDLQSNAGDIVNKYIAKLQDRNALYQKGLETYIKNYPKNLEQARRNDLYFYGANLAKGLNPKAGEKFNPLQNQAEIVNLIKSLEDIKNSNVDYANEVAGNTAIANDLGLPNSAAFANKNLLTAYSMKERDAVKQAIANAQIKAKIYGIDEKTALMRELQNLKGQNAIDVAMLYSGMGYPGVGLNQQGTVQQPVQQAPVQSVDPRQQFFN